jgi:hypothetical protein
MAVPYCVCVDVDSDGSANRTTCYTHCSKMAAPHYVCVDVCLDYSADLLHTLQLNGRWTLCMHWCVFRSFCSVNVLLHTLQEYWHSSWRSVRASCKITRKKNWEYQQGDMWTSNRRAVRCLVGMGRGVRGDRGNKGGFRLTRKLWNIFPATQFFSNILEFTQH